MADKDKILKAGPFNILYENGFLRYIRYGNDEIIRMIYFALRDENWGTYENFIENEQIQILDDGFKIEYDCFHKKGDVKIFQWKTSISASDSGEINFVIQGKALEDLQKNRSGFCILHPIKECAGKYVSLEHEDGSNSQSVFPVNIAQEDPFKEIKSMRWQVSVQEYELMFDGDIFQTEDQRNWTDASYKTFCTPLRIPFPVQLKKGDRVQQSVIFKPLGKISFSKKSDEDKIELQVSDRLISFPAIGVTDAKGALNEKVVQAIHSLNLDHLRIDVNLSDDDWKQNFKSVSERATGLKLPLSVVVHLPDDFNDKFESFLLLVRENAEKFKSLLLLNYNALTTRQQVIHYVTQIKEQLPGVLVGAGTEYNFAELNRNRFVPGKLDFVSYSIDPQVHGFDDKTLIENLEGQRYTATSSKIIFQDQDIHISPITFRARFNPNASSESGKVQTIESQIDPRQRNAFGAVWTLGSIKQLLEGGASSITCFQVCGELGIMSTEGTPYPIYEALQKLLLLRTNKVISSSSSHPLIVDGIFFDDRNGLVWNYTPAPQHFELLGTELSLEPFGIKALTF